METKASYSRRQLLESSETNDDYDDDEEDYDSQNISNEVDKLVKNDDPMNMSSYSDSVLGNTVKK